MKIIKTFEQFSKINEGTWALPDNTKAAQELVDFLNANEIIPYNDENIKKIFNLVGDDNLYDSFAEYEDNIKYDIISFVDDFIANKDFHIEKNDADPKVFDILKKIEIPEKVKGFYKNIKN